jgi:GntR family phosphonate transport system transcriptional regulator
MNVSEGAREPGVSLWRQIARALEDEIAAGSLAPGARLPTEAQMAARFAVNRHTVRRALEELQRGGLVRVEQGRGSFVAEDVLDYAVSPRTRFSEWIRRHNKEPSGTLLELREMPADQTVATELGLRAGARTVMLERLGLADGRPVSISQHWFPAARFPGLLQALRESGISDALATCGLPDYRRQTTRVSARLPSAPEATLLRMPRNRPLLITENINVDPQGAVVEYGTSRYPTPRVQIVFEP